MNAKDLFKIKGPSSSSVSGVSLEYPGGTLTLKFDYVRDNIVYSSGFKFLKVRALRHCAEIHCNFEHVKLAYDRLVEIYDSNWKNDLLNFTADDLRNMWVMNHYLFYFDGSGSFEIIAESWEEIPEQKGTLQF